MNRLSVSSHPTVFWHKLDDDRVQCDVCPRSCRLKEGQRGMCFVRACEDGRVVLKTYGRSSGFCIDPIEKKPLNHFLPGTPVLSFGTAGCNLFCRFCQNWDISKARSMDRLMDRALPEQIADKAIEMGCRSVAYTYNDPTVFLEYAVDVAKACRRRGLKNVAVTAGYICSEARVELFRYMDAANVDLKAFSEKFYRFICSSSLQSVLETLIYLVRETDIWLEVTNLVIPGENDSDVELNAMTEWLAKEIGVSVPLHFTAFHPDFKMRETQRTPLDTLLRACKIARRNGIRYAYAGNVHNEENDSTYCHNCGYRLIGRDWFVMTEWNLEDGKCPQCGAGCSGVFENSPGEWGSRRMPVPMNR